MTNVLKRIVAGVASVAIFYYALTLVYRLLFTGSFNSQADAVLAVFLFIIGWPAVLILLMLFGMAGMFALTLAKYALTGKWEEPETKKENSP